MPNDFLFCWMNSASSSFFGGFSLFSIGKETLTNIYIGKLTHHSPIQLISFYRTRVRSLGWECLSVTESLTNSLLFSKLDWCEDDNSKLVEVVTVTHVDDEKRADNSLVQIWKVKFGHKVKFLFILWAQGFKVWSRFWSWFLVKILKMSDQDLCKNLWYDLKKLLW